MPPIAIALLAMLSMAQHPPPSYPSLQCAATSEVVRQISGGGSGLWRTAAALPDAELRKLKYDDPRLDSFALEAEKRYGLPRGMLLAVKNAAERSNSWQVSSKGAKGVMQFIDATRKSYPHDPLHPLESIDAGARYLADLLRQYGGNVMAALAHYNGGRRQGKAVLAGQKPPAAETRKYLSNVASFMDRTFGG